MTTNGTNARDTFNGTRFDDEINGLGGDDFFRGSRGQDRLDGGANIDTVDYVLSFTGGIFPTPHEGEAVDVDLQRATQSGGFADGDVLISIENVGGSGQNDVIKGNGEANVLVGNGGDDLVEGRGGDDRLFGDNSFGYFVGVQGNDVLDGGAGNDELFGDGGNDTLIGGTGANILNGGVGIDTSSYATSAFGMLVSLADGSGIGIALSLGSTDGDQLLGIENIIGSNFADSIAGSSIANVLDGGAGNDTISGRGGADTLRGNTGIDTASYTTSSAGVNVVLGTLAITNTPFGTLVLETAVGTGTGGDAQGDTLSGFENLTGSNFADALTGNVAANRLDGGGGDDSIFGGGGNDTIIGGSQTDIDRLSGGDGLDTFLYLSRDDSRNALNATGDFIVDFTIGQDKIDLKALNLNPANLIFENRVIDGVNFSIVTEDVNGSGLIDVGEFSINVRIEGAGFVSLADILV